MSITVVGPGALGCLFAALLAKAGEDVRLLDHSPRRAREIGEKGLTLMEGDGSESYRVPVFSDPRKIGNTAFLLLAVKSHDTLGALHLAAPLLANETLLIALQNGIAHHQPLNDTLGAGRWVAAVTAQGATLEGPGCVRHGGDGPTTLGFLGEAGSGERQKQLAAGAAVLGRAMPEVAVSDQVLVPVWNKLIINVGINALTALYDCPNGQLLQIPQALERMAAAVGEAAAVASAKGIMIVAEPLAMTIGVCRATSNNISSMLQDVRHGRQTEIEAINGALVREANALGIAVPVNEALTTAVRGLQK